MIYTIIVSGSGAESYLFPLNDEQLKTAKSIDLENTNIIDTLLDLEIEDPSEAHLSVFGPFVNSFFISIFDEDEDIIETITPNDEYKKVDLDNEFEHYDKLIYENLIEGNFYKVTFISDEFDIEKLFLIFTESGNNQILINILYDGYEANSFELLDYKSVGDSAYITNMTY